MSEPKPKRYYYHQRYKRNFIKKSLKRKKHLLQRIAMKNLQRIKDAENFIKGQIINHKEKLWLRIYNWFRIKLFQYKLIH